VVNSQSSTRHPPMTSTEGDEPVPKMKTHRGAASRFAVTKNGKLLRGHAKLNHLLSKKSSRQKRRLGRTSIVAEGDRRTVRRLLGR
jgi:large subunit ribosomal protein L35